MRAKAVSRWHDGGVVCDDAEIPLSALLSRVVVAFAIEFDNEFERRMPHRTTVYGASGDPGQVPWLVSMAMWVNCMRFVPVEGISTTELAHRGRMTRRTAPMILKRMGRWWGYLRVDPESGTATSRVIRATESGAQAQRVWQPLTGEIEQRWRSRFGEGAVDRLGAALGRLVAQLPADLPDFPPVGEHPRAHPEVLAAVSDLNLSALTARALIAYSDDLEQHLHLPTALGANVLRVICDDGVPVRELGPLTGLAQMGIDNSLSVLTRRGLLDIESAGRGRARVARPSTSGTSLQHAYNSETSALEHRWAQRYGKSTITDLREALTAVAGTSHHADPRLLEGARAHPDGWRAQLPAPHELPHYPMVSHRGGFPDGS